MREPLRSVGALDVMELVESEKIRTARADRVSILRYRGGVGAKAVAAMNDRYARRPLEKLRAPIERRVSAADDQHPLSPKDFRICHDVVDTTPVPRLRAS